MERDVKQPFVFHGVDTQSIPLPNWDLLPDSTNQRFKVVCENDIITLQIYFTTETWPLDEAFHSIQTDYMSKVKATESWRKTSRGEVWLYGRN